MRRWILPAAAGLGLLAACALRTRAHDNSFKTRIFGDTPNVAVRGILAAPNPWVAQNSRARLEPGGALDVRIRGLVVAGGLTAAGTPVNPAFIGRNPVPVVRVAVTWVVPNPTAPVFIQETGPLPLDANGDLSARVNLGPPPPGAERPILLVRAGPAPGAGPYIALSDFVSDFGDDEPREDDD